jgi:hypothetical protein
VNQVMSLVEIEAQFQSEWVLIEDPQTTDTLQVMGGRVLWHSSDRDEVYRKVRELQPLHHAILYTGKMPKDMAIIL